MTIETPQIPSLQALKHTPPGEHLWTAALEQTRSRSPASFEQWFSSVQYDGFETGQLSLTARDEFVRDWVKAHFLPDLLSHLARLAGEANPAALRVKWSISNGLERPVCQPRRRNSEPPASIAPPSGVSSGRPRSERPSRYSRANLTAALNPKHTFPNFVVGPSNELAHAAAFASAGGGGPRYNPLFIAGGTGLGKTHLMHAIAHKVLAAHRVRLGRAFHERVHRGPPAPQDG